MVMKNNNNKKPNIYGLLDAMHKKFIMQIRDQPAYQKPIVRNKAVVFGGG